MHEEVTLKNRRDVLSRGVSLNHHRVATQVFIDLRTVLGTTASVLLTPEQLGYCPSMSSHDDHIKPMPLSDDRCHHGYERSTNY